MLNFFKSKKKNPSDILQSIFPFDPITNRLKHPSNEDIQNLIYLVLSNQEDKGGKALNKLISIIFNSLNYKVKIKDGKEDKKVDIAVFDQNNNPLYGIQCKSHSISSKHANTLQMRDHISAMIHQITNQGFYPIIITTSYIGKGAIEDFTNQALLIDRIGVIELFNKYFPREMANILNHSLLEYLDKYDDEGNLILSHNCTVCSTGKLYLVKYSKNVKYHCSNCYTLHNLKDGRFKAQKTQKSTHHKKA